MFKFDEIWIICKIDDKDRYKNVKSISNIIDCNVLYTCDKPILMQHYPNDLTGDNKNYNGNYGNAFDCALNHYTVIKQAYKRELNNILILEDDVEFIYKDTINLFLEAINKVPKDFDIIKFYNTYDEYHMPIWNGINNPFHKGISNTCLWSTLCYGLSRKGMKLYLNYQNDNFRLADYPFQDIVYNCNYYENNSLIITSKKFKSQILKNK